MGGMAREISAGGVVLREEAGVWQVALIEPQKETAAGGGKKSGRPEQAVLTLPKGLLDAGEKAPDGAIREVFEETGVRAKVVKKLSDIKYVYTRAWGDGARVFKIVSFYLMTFESGEIDAISPEMRVEVKRALWVPIEGAAKLMAYSSERKVVGQAWELVASGRTKQSAENNL